MLGIISDTHDNVENIKKAVALFKGKVDLVIHCGDIIAPATIQFFNGLKIKFILGNCDGDIERLKKKISEINGEFLGDRGEFEYLGKTFGIYHGTDPGVLEGMINSRKYNYILTGHTHKQRNEVIGTTRIINPGAHYYGTEGTIALLDVEKDEVEFVKC